MKTNQPLLRSLRRYPREGDPGEDQPRLGRCTGSSTLDPLEAPAVAKMKEKRNQTLIKLLNKINKTNKVKQRKEAYYGR
jgi:hypothetical protein